MGCSDVAGAVMKMKRIWYFLFCWIVPSIFISACKTKTVTLELGIFTGSNWGVADSDSYFLIDKAIEKFEKAHPGIIVHYYSGIQKNDYEEWFSEQVLQGKMPDVAIIMEDQFDRLASMGILKDLTPLMYADGRIKSWEYFPSTWVSGTYHGRQYALPYQADFMLMAVNKTLLDKHRIDMPERNWTWDDFYLLCKKLTADQNGDSVIDSAGVCNYTWQEAVYSNGARIFDEEGKRVFFSDSKVIEAVRFMQRLTALTGDTLFTQSDFDAGKVAFMPLSFTKYQAYVSYPYKINKDLNYDWRCVTMPAGYSGNNISEIDTLLMGISSYTKHEKLAFDLLETFTHDKEIQTSLFQLQQGASGLRMVSASDKVMNILEGNMDKNNSQYSGGLLADIMVKGILPPKFHEYTDDMVLADSAINKIITDKKDAENSLKVLQRTLQVRMEK
jgi:multiple sugar transport system substrate-binding protein